MSNEIRPSRLVYPFGHDVVLEIAVESAVEKFTWLIVDGQGRPVAARKIDRSPTSEELKQGKAVPLGGEFSIVVTDPDDFETAQPEGGELRGLDSGSYQVRLYNGFPPAGAKTARGMFGKLELLDEDAFTISESDDHAEAQGGGQPDVGEPLRVALVREGPDDRIDRSSPVTFEKFRDFLAGLTDDDVEGPDGEVPRRRGRFDDLDAWPAFGNRPYRALREAAQRFVETSRVSDFTDLIPQGYLEGKLTEHDPQFPGLALPRDTDVDYLPGVELIWNYWLEEGMLVQTLNVILARFQNRRLPGRNPLERFDITPLLPLRNRLWGFAEDEVHRLTVRRRAVEYEYEYGLPLIGRAIPRRSTVVERRSGFLEAFHQVLFLAHQYFKELDDLTVQADAFPLYRALRDCHIVLSQGTQNQYGEMAVAARAEFLVMQSILAEPQMREFLGGRPMTPYPEAWMDRVDSMKAIQGWGDTSIMHFNDLAVIGEQLVLTIRLGNWADPDVGRVEAGNWAQALRNAIQKYGAAYRMVTGVDLSQEPSAERPSTLLARRQSGARVRA